MFSFTLFQCNQKKISKKFTAFESLASKIFNLLLRLIEICRLYSETAISLFHFNATPGYVQCVGTDRNQVTQRRASGI